jgi:nitrite reductase (NADH) small subunit
VPDEISFSVLTKHGTLHIISEKKTCTEKFHQVHLIFTDSTLQHEEFFLARHLIDKPVNLEDGGPGVSVSVDGRQIALYEFEGSVYAVDNRCPHRGGPMADGPVSGPTITCPLHSWSFDMRSGEAVGRPGATIACFPVAKDPSGKIAIEIA